MKNRAFLVNKNYKISHKKLENLYISLVNLDKKMKGWKLMGTEEKDFRFEVEKCILESLIFYIPRGLWIYSNFYTTVFIRFSFI